MSLDPKTAAALVLHRFGLGPRAGAITRIASDPRAALLAELERSGAGLIVNEKLLSSQQAATAVYNYRQERQAREIAKSMAEQQKAAGSDMENTMEPKPEPAAPAASPQPEVNVPQRIFQSEAKARLDAALAAEIGFVERLVWFWSNHFCISADAVPNMAGGYEREAIRTHVLGRFAD